MRIAAIDIGTNSIHMIVVQVRPDLSFEVIDREKDMVRLGAGGLDGRALTPEAMHAALPDSTLSVIEGAAHMPNLERPEEFNKVLGEFMARLTSSPS